MTAPDKIWLTEAGPSWNAGEVSWCQDRITPEDTEYLRANLVPRIPDILAINATRYAMGRMTYTVGETVEWLMANWGNLSPKAQTVIKRDLSEAMNKDTEQRMNADLTGEKPRWFELGMDRREWDKLAAFFGR